MFFWICSFAPVFSQRYIKYTLVHNFSMSVLIRRSFKTAIFSRFSKVAIATSNFMNKVYNGGQTLNSGANPLLYTLFIKFGFSPFTFSDFGWLRQLPLRQSYSVILLVKYLHFFFQQIEISAHSFKKCIPSNLKSGKLPKLGKKGQKMWGQGSWGLGQIALLTECQKMLIFSNLNFGTYSCFLGFWNFNFEISKFQNFNFNFGLTFAVVKHGIFSLDWNSG